MPEGYTVDPAKLDAHRHDLEQAVAGGNQVVDAGNQVTPGGWDNAYGLMFQAFPQATRPIATAFISFTKDAVQALETTSAALGQAAVEYQTNEHHAAEALQELERKIADLPGMQVGSGALPPDDVPEPGTPVTGAGSSPSDGQEAQHDA
ncbi:hypothetical protein GCM10022222_27570 [Amycolatopsis ultiminotia]|uniref:Excreted virulence factor EspC, type VII ESX diderm n=1 Tax=Amycolatopsis ultiminotia TaxID=543629 RepID=A0ABP6W0U3_9PSEU